MAELTPFQAVRLRDFMELHAEYIKYIMDREWDEEFSYRTFMKFEPYVDPEGGWYKIHVKVRTPAKNEEQVGYYEKRFMDSLHKELVLPFIILECMMWKDWKASEGEPTPTWS